MPIQGVSIDKGGKESNSAYNFSIGPFTLERKYLTDECR